MKNIRFDTPVLDDIACKKIVTLFPEHGEAVVEALSRCPQEMTVLALMCMAIQECIPEKGFAK